MATISAAQAGNWSNTNTWTGGVVPGNGDAAVLNGFAVAMDIARIPASGTLLSITDAGKAGYLTVALDTLGSCSINATTITCGTHNGGLIVVTGTTTNTLTINGTTGTGGSSTNSYCIGITGSGNLNTVLGLSGSSGTGSMGCNWGSSGTWNHTGVITGGSGNSSYGAYGSAGTFNITGTVTGGSGSSGSRSYGVLWDSSGVATLNGSMVNTRQMVAWGGKPPVWTVGAYDAKWGDIYYGPEPLDHQLLSGVTCGRITGNRVDATASSVLSTHSYGDPDSQTTGTWVAPNTNTVWTGTTYGVAGGTSGTKRASSITNCEAGNVKKDVAIDDVTGTYEAAGGGAWPLIGGLCHGGIR